MCKFYDILWSPAMWMLIYKTAEGKRLYHGQQDMHVDVLKLLLGRGDIHPNYVDKELGQTALSWAPECGLYWRAEMMMLTEGSGHVMVIRLLLTQYDINADKADDKGKRPLSYARIYRHDAIETLLREHISKYAGFNADINETPVTRALDEEA
jgi:ankyrin repeat protein